VPVVALCASDLGPAVTVEAEGRLLDACDEARAPVAFSCRSANCGTCRVEVLAGRDLLEPARDDELDVLSHTGALPGDRLACQIVLRPGPGLVRLRWGGPRRAGE
jgi:ferredoxin